jgi:hypothetical protein
MVRWNGCGAAGRMGNGRSKYEVRSTKYERQDVKRGAVG